MLMRGHFGKENVRGEQVMMGDRYKGGPLSPIAAPASPYVQPTFSKVRRTPQVSVNPTVLQGGGEEIDLECNENLEVFETVSGRGCRAHYEE